MPANEQTWRQSKLLHVIFGVSALAMLASTIWMMAADHNREWKRYQRSFRQLDRKMTEARIDAERTTDYDNRLRELEAQLDAAQNSVPDQALFDDFRELVVAHDEGYNWPPVETAYQRLAGQASSAQRTALLDHLNNVILAAMSVEENAAREMKFERAEFDVVRSAYEIAIGESAPAAELTRMQADVDEVKLRVDALTADFQEVNRYRKRLENVYDQITEEESRIAKQIEDFKAEIERLDSTLAEQTIDWLEPILQSPVLDAFNSPDRIEQDWLPDLTITYGSFGDVARFDRCITCHQGIARSEAGSAVEPAFEKQHVLSIELETPDDAPVLEQGDTVIAPSLENMNVILEAAYGLRLAPEGFLDANDVVVYVVFAESRAARAGLQMGDVITHVADAAILDRSLALEYLVRRVNWGLPLELTVRRGYPHPFATHPRLDLFVGSMSVHNKTDFGCTICHEGQGSGTEFRWAAHTPDNPLQRNEWQKEHGWVNNHYAMLGITHLWDFPMLPSRFAESSCLKCHHDVMELEPSEQFPDPPAPKLMKGYHLVRQYGCFGCHEINGYDGPNKRIGPDLRTEPNFFAAAQQLLVDPALSDEQRRMAREVIDAPEALAVRKLLAESIDQERRRAEEAGDAPEVSPASLEMAEILGANVETPGSFRRVGPSLRFVASKLDFDFLYDWISEPKRFRPTTRMPQFFGLHDHLMPTHATEGEHGDGAQHEQADDGGSGLADALRFESVEVYAIAKYLDNHSQPLEYLDMPASGSAERGKALFETRGCLACHQHKDFPDVDYPRSTFGPDLSRIGAKLAPKGEDGRRWLYTWIREPTRYHVRTKMPNLFLEPISQVVDGKESVTDPAADIVAYLFESSQPWQPVTPPEPSALEADVDELAMEHLTDSLSKRLAREYLANGIPASYASGLKADERVLVGEGQMTLDKKLEYIGRRTIGKYGCSACHDIPGFESAKPIGTGLSEWGRKQTSRLAFEQIQPFITGPHGGLEQSGHGHLEVKDMDPDTGFFVHALLTHRREGFLWQKLRAPRSYDYKKTKNKGYNQRLRMPKFPLDADEIEAIITFVLGLVSEPPAERYVYHPEPEREAIVNGQRVLEKYNCGGCHLLETETWEFEFDPDTFESEFGTSLGYDWAFLTPHFTPEEIEASQQLDRRGLGRAKVFGMPIVDAQGNLVVDEHPDEGYPVNYFWPFESTLVNGGPWLVGEQTGGQMIPVHRVTRRRPRVGGDLAQLLYPKALAMATDPGVKPADAWAWVPPPLVGEGSKVQTDWLHEFLLNPYRIRPAVILRMPKFNMSPEEASDLVRYFAAKDDAAYPFQYDPRRQADYLASQEAQRPDRLHDAFRLVIDNVVYCGKCHYIGDYVPPGAASAHAPNLEGVHERIRPDFLHRWLAKPASELPYTVMPENFKNAAPPELFEGTREEQLEAVVDLLLNYDTYMKRQTSISEQVKPAPTGEQTGGGQ